MPVEITRRSRFSAAHRLHNPDLSDEENLRVYGRCNNPHGHGHNYYLEVTVEGEPDPQTGMIMNLSDLDAIVDREIITKVDHRHFNHDVPFTRDIIPTVENLAIVFWNVLEKPIPGGMLKTIRLWESENNSASYSGPAKKP